MKLVVQVKLTPSPEVARALEATLRASNDAANWLSVRAQGKEDERDRSRKALQSVAYRELKERGLSAQPALHVIRKVADAYKTRRSNLKAGNYGPERSERCQRIANAPIQFRPGAAQAYDDRCLSWQYDQQTVSIWTTAGRIRGVPFVCATDALKALAEHRQGESDLVMRDGMFFLIATIDIPDIPATEPHGWLGVDLGIVNIATTSDGEIMSGRQVNRYRRRMLNLRRKLQKKRTESAKRALKRNRRREARYATQRNHIIAKKIVHTAERTSRGVALEDLSGIRRRVTARKPQRSRLHSWAFAQLGGFIEYKARRAGVARVHVDPRNTSRQCSECGHTHKTNRVTQAKFACRSCGIILHADCNGSRNIAHRADAVWQRGAVNRPNRASQVR